jgi:hypothetical protein
LCIQVGGDGMPGKIYLDGKLNSENFCLLLSIFAKN